MQNSLTSVEELLKKHEAFEKTLQAQEEKIDTLEQLAQALLAQEHYASQQIKGRCDGVLERRNHIKEASAARRNKLVDSRNYQQFLRNVHEVGWRVSEFIIIATIVDQWVSAWKMKILNNYRHWDLQWMSSPMTLAHFSRSNMALWSQ